MGGRLLVIASVALLGAGIWLVVLLNQEAEPRLADRPGVQQAGQARHGGPGTPGAPGEAPDGPSLAAESGPGGLTESGQRIIVTGKVVDATTRKPVANVEVVFRGRQLYGEASTASGGDGTFSIELRPGNYRVVALGPGLTTVGPPSFVLRDASGGSSSVVVEVARTAVVEGTVRYSDKSPVSDVEVEYRSKLGSHTIEGLPEAGPLGQPPPTTDDQGHYHIDVVPGTVEVEVRTPDGVAEGTIAASTGGRTYRLDLEVPLPSTVAGVVVDSTGAGIAGAQVQISPRGSPEKDWKTVDTDSAGRFSVTGVRAGRVVLEAQAPGYAASTPSTRSLDPGGVLDARLVLPTARTVEGVVVDGTGAPLAGVSVRANRSRSRMLPQATTDAGGRFVLDGLGPGPYEIVASHEGTLKRLPSVRPGNTPLRIVLATSLGIRGVVLGDSGPVTSFSVRPVSFTGDDDGRKRTWGKSGQSFSSPEGAFEIALPRPGKYDLRVSASGYSPSIALDVVAPPDRWGQVEVRLQRGVSVAGTVRDRDTGEAVSNARVSMPSGYVGAGVLTADNGSFELTGVAPGKRTLSVSHPSFRSVSVPVTAGSSGSVIVELDAR